MRPELILWDWNGTLLDDVELCENALNRLLQRYGYPSGTTTSSTGRFLASQSRIITSAPGSTSPATALPSWRKATWRITSRPAPPVR